jgi:hypothetical protein
MRRPLFALLLCLLVAGLPLAVQAGQSVSHVDHASMQHPDADPGDCGGDGTASAACAAHCATGACVTGVIAAAQSTSVSMRPCGHETIATPECPTAPDTAPPKTLLA